MQTIYYQTSSFIRHEGNVVDLGAYRRKLSAVSGGDWEDVPVQEPAPTQPEAAAAGRTCAGWALPWTCWPAWPWWP